MAACLERHAAVECVLHGLGSPCLTRGMQSQPPPAASLPLAAGLQGQPFSLGLALQPFTAIMGQL